MTWSAMHWNAMPWDPQQWRAGEWIALGRRMMDCIGMQHYGLHWAAAVWRRLGGFHVDPIGVSFDSTDSTGFTLGFQNFSFASIDFCAFPLVFIDLHGLSIGSH